MLSERQAILAAVVADPADDTPRLVFADWLDEHGNRPRAEFIRLQVEAERLHPDSNERVRLEEHAKSYFAEHWIEWWSEVCAAIDFPMPVPKPRGTIGRILRRVPIINPPGYPYHAAALFDVVTGRLNFGANAKLESLTCVSFRRGFPESVEVFLPLPSPDGDFLTRWHTIAPLTALHIAAVSSEVWPDGPHVAGVRSLTFEGYDPGLLIDAFTTPHLGRLEELSLCVHNSTNPYDREALNELNTMFAEGIARVIVLPRLRQLRRLSIPVWSDRAAELVSNAEYLSGLESLELGTLPNAVLAVEFTEDPIDASRRVAILARSPHLAGLRELRVSGDLDASSIEAVIRKPVWTGLRKLELEGFFSSLEPLANSDDLDELEEFRLLGVEDRPDSNVLTPLVRSPLIKRIRHFALVGVSHKGDRSLASLIDAVDRSRIETFALGMKGVDPSVLDLCRSRFGDRFRQLE